jgi:hypothetical protein
MKNFVIAAALASISLSSFADPLDRLKNVGDIVVIEDERALQSVIGKICLYSHLVESKFSKIKVVVGHKLTKITLKVQEEASVGKHISADVEYSIFENDGGRVISGGTEIRCTMDLSRQIIVKSWP